MEVEKALKLVMVISQYGYVVWHSHYTFRKAVHVVRDERHYYCNEAISESNVEASGKIRFAATELVELTRGAPAITSLTNEDDSPVKRDVSITEALLEVFVWKQ